MKRIFVHALVFTSVLAVLSACSTRSVNRAPVEDRGGSVASAPGKTVVTPTRPPRGVENAGKAGYYTVQAGDNVFRIGKNFGYSVADIARWNNLQDPYIIEIGDVLRVSPPAGDVQTRPVPVAGSAKPADSVVASPTPKPVAEAEINWAWPSSGPILQGYDGVKNKGVDIAGKAGDPVLAAADGVVVYAGSGLRGYGNLLILKHNNTYLSAYAHNQALLVKEKESVKRGQKIAEMGQSDADRVKLHFEVRKTGTPVDPMRYLPNR